MAGFKKMSTLIIFLLICSFALGGCKQSNPEITTSITLSNITEEEYNQIGDSKQWEDVTINDLRKLYINVEITNSKQATNRTITIPNLFIIDKYDRFRTIGGETSEQNNIGTEDTAKSTAYIIFDSRGLSEQELKNIYDNSLIYIAYKLTNSDLVEKRVSIGDNIITNQ